MSCQATGKTAVDERPAASPAGSRVLDQRELERAALTSEDLPARTFEALLGPARVDASPVKPAKCQAVQDAASMSSPFPPRGRVKQVISSAEGDRGGAMMLASYPPDQADAVTRALRTALRDCTEFTPLSGFGFDYEDVTPLPDPELGDWSASFRLLQVLSSKGERPLKVPMTVTVVRIGSTIATFQSVTRGDGPAVLPQDAVDEQLSKLADASR
ncbi:hypothetical protein AB0M39_01785 [Streptomyces sp. NPDC051907]|uniref:hypothetical protein n=1 Tax=Streptomyces sp. NPDC051907 TaxID=3155284 RepID=UPI0034379D1A